MKTRLWIIVALGLLMAATHQKDVKDDAAKQETAKLQGTWRVVSAERDGMKVPDDESKKITLLIKGDKFTARRTENSEKPEEKIYDMSFTLDPSKNPKWIDVNYVDGERKGESSLGIYELNGDTLKICMNRGTTRPMEFKTEAETSRHLMVLKREK